MVEVVHWNPRRAPRMLRGLPGPIRRHFERPVGNFGDLLGPLIVHRLAEQRGLPVGRGATRVLSVGSILHLARDGDTVWGTGKNGKIADAGHRFVVLDVRAVRGPLTAEWLRNRGIVVPEVYGDPGLLFPRLFPEVVGQVTQRSGMLIVPNLNDFQELDRFRREVLNPRSSLEQCIRRISASEFVIASSLHALIIADALGVPARGVQSRFESPFKYEDYYLATGRQSAHLARDVPHAMEIGPVGPLRWDPDPLLDAFPSDLFS